MSTNASIVVVTRILGISVLLLGVAHMILQFGVVAAVFRRVEFPFPLPVLEDNMGAIALTTGPTPHHQRTKHIGYRFHYVRSLVQQGILRFQHQDTAEQPADLFTKFLTEAVFTKHAEVILGIKQLKIVQKPLPRSTRIYLELHNQQLEQTKRDMEERAQLSRD